MAWRPNLRSRGAKLRFGCSLGRSCAAQVRPSTPKRRPRGSKLSPRGLQELQVDEKSHPRRPEEPKTVETLIFDDPTTLFEGPERPWKGNWRPSWRPFRLYGGRVGAPKAILEATETSLKHRVESKWLLECDMQGV